MKLTNEQRQLFAKVGRHGGQKTVEKYGKNHFSILGKKGAEAKKLKKLNAVDKSLLTNKQGVATIQS